MYISGWINVVYPHSGRLFSQKNEGSSGTSYNTDNLENVMPNERSETLKDKHCVIPLYAISEIGKFIETES